MAVMVVNGKKFNNDNPREFGAKIRRYHSPELWLLKFLPLAYHHSHFLAATLDFTSFWGGGAIFFCRLAVLG